MEVMRIFEVCNTNLDVVNDGIISYGFFINKEKAYQFCYDSVINKASKDIEEDNSGLLKEYKDKSLSYSPSFIRPSVYYRSFYGNYRCACFINEHFVKG